MSLTTHHDLVRDTPTTWPAARAWLYAWVRTDVPGYRAMSVAAAPITVTSGTYRGDQLVTQLATDLSGVGWDAAIANTGRVTLSDGAAAALTYTDRLGWLLGLAPEAGFVDPSTASVSSRWVPPCAVPLIGATWTEVSTDREVETEIDRAGRRSGYVAGAARIWRWRVTCTRWALQAIQTGVVLSGKVTLSPHPTAVTANDASTPTGGITGYIVRASGARWIGPTEDVAELEIVIAGVPE